MNLVETHFLKIGESFGGHTLDDIIAYNYKGNMYIRIYTSKQDGRRFNVLLSGNFSNGVTLTCSSHNFMEDIVCINDSVTNFFHVDKLYQKFRKSRKKFSQITLEIYEEQKEAIQPEPESENIQAPARKIFLASDVGSDGGVILSERDGEFVAVYFEATENGFYCEDMDMHVNSVEEFATKLASEIDPTMIERLPIFSLKNAELRAIEVLMRRFVHSVNRAREHHGELPFEVVKKEEKPRASILQDGRDMLFSSGKIFIRFRNIINNRWKAVEVSKESGHDEVPFAIRRISEGRTYDLESFIASVEEHFFINYKKMYKVNVEQVKFRVTEELVLASARELSSTPYKSVENHVALVQEYINQKACT